MKEPLLYPIQNKTRAFVSLDGFWRFSFDPKKEGEANQWSKGLPNSIKMPVPASFADLFTDRASRDYCGDFWYERDIFIQEDRDDRDYWLRFGSVTHRCTVFFNGVQVAKHEGGFLPFCVNVTALVKRGEVNRLSLKANNELSESALPCGCMAPQPNGTNRNTPYFDFFNYAGIHRSVLLQRLPKEQILDYEVSYRLSGADAQIPYRVETTGEQDVFVTLADASGALVAQGVGKTGCLEVANAHLWEVGNAYLYTLHIELRDGDRLVDAYSDRIGIRTVTIENCRFLINGKPVYLKGFGKHEDFELIGKGVNLAVMRRDYECLNWIGANCYRTSHYPYDEEWYRYADEEGIVIIDEVPAVGMMRSTINFVEAGTGIYTSFFETSNIPLLLENHKAQVRDMIRRDKNHPSVIAFSLFNEPETTSKYAHDYFAAVFAEARSCDPQKRPLTGALEKNSHPDLCQVYELCDFICLNRYYGWYITPGQLGEAERLMREELDLWAAKKLNKPFVFAEYGADTLAESHQLPSIMWSQEYQIEYFDMNHRVMAEYDFIQGELAWNFADFQTSEGIFRPIGNRKGVFTRTRQPKDIAYYFKKRWQEQV